MTDRHLSLIGFMGAGKSTLGAELAARRGLDFVDLDRVIVGEAGAEIADIFATHGEAEFRRRECDALRRAMDGPPVILSTGGGVVEAETNRTLLNRGSLVIWLDVRFETVRSRLRQARPGERPLVDALGWGGLEELFERRRILYAATGHYRFDADELAPAKLVRSLLSALDAHSHPAP